MTTVAEQDTPPSVDADLWNKWNAAEGTSSKEEFDERCKLLEQNKAARDWLIRWAIPYALWQNERPHSDDDSAEKELKARRNSGDVEYAAYRIACANHGIMREASASPPSFVTRKSTEALVLHALTLSASRLNVHWEDDDEMIFLSQSLVTVEKELSKHLRPAPTTHTARSLLIALDELVGVYSNVLRLLTEREQRRIHLRKGKSRAFVPDDSIEFKGELREIVDRAPTAIEMTLVALRDGGAKWMDDNMSPDTAGKARSVDLHMKLQDAKESFQSFRQRIDNADYRIDLGILYVENIVIDPHQWFDHARKELRALLDIRGLDSPVPAPTVTLTMPKPARLTNPLQAEPTIHPDLKAPHEALASVCTRSHAMIHCHAEMAGMGAAANSPEPHWAELKQEWSGSYLDWCDAIGKAKELAKSPSVAAIMDAGEARPEHRWTTRTIIDLENLAAALHPMTIGGPDGLGIVRRGLVPLPEEFPALVEAVSKRAAELRSTPVSAVPPTPTLTLSPDVLEIVAERAVEKLAHALGGNANTGTKARPARTEVVLWEGAAHTDRNIRLARTRTAYLEAHGNVAAALEALKQAGNAIGKSTFYDHLNALDTECPGWRAHTLVSGASGNP